MIDVLLLRDARSANATKKMLKKKNLTFFHESLFEIIDLPILNDIEITIQEHDFLILTSLNAIWNLSAFSINIPVLVVGEKLANFIKKTFNANIIFIAKNAADLHDFIFKNEWQNKKILYLRGEEITFDFKKYFINTAEIITYKVKWKNNFSLRLIRLFQEQQIKNVLFYSQNCAKYFISLIKKNCLHVKNMNAISMSENIVNQLSILDWKTNVYNKSEIEMINNILKF